ncbi:MAG: beta-fructosidase [Deltaproteobacteria bacterium]|uniref:Beta-fructosidase n=1 Tax=Candidatus Zymogenus saltonus TaxID=2844893 RepID=A0A9D8KE77_9DELT|nr:beta-fructosidase [Candidatus Zymogenus saltonus]
MADKESISHAVHPGRFTWDFWYHYDAGKRIFHVLYLNAERELAKTDQHHFHSVVGYAKTADFEKFDWVNDDVFTADSGSWDNTSIWTGDVVRVKNGYLMFYTSRDAREESEGDFLTQNVGAALSADFISWERIPDFRIAPDARYYETAHVDGDTTIQAWRDPFVFRHGGETWMIIAAKAKALEVGRKGAVGLLKAKRGSLTQWEAMPPIYPTSAPGIYDELEVPQAYIDKDGKLTLVYSMKDVYDHAPGTGGKGGLHAVSVGDPAEAVEEQQPEVVLGYSSGVYAARVIPELGGVVVGFDLKDGGFVKSGVTTGLRSTDRDFSGIGV